MSGYFINALGSAIYPFSTPETGAVNLSQLLKEVDVSGCEINVVYNEIDGVEQYVLETSSQDITFPEAVQIRSWIGNLRKPTILFSNSCTISFLRNQFGSKIENLLFRKPGGSGISNDGQSLTPFIKIGDADVEVCGCEFFIEDTSEIIEKKIFTASIKIESDNKYSTIHHNIFNNVPTGLYFSGRSVEIYNNTMYSVISCGMHIIQETDTNYVCYIHNNIICVKDKYTFGMKLKLFTAIFDYNTIYPNRFGLNYWFLAGSKIRSPGVHANSYNPLFINADFGDFGLKPDSPCIHTGKYFRNRGALPTTYYGTINPDSKPGNGTSENPFNVEQVYQLCHGYEVYCVIESNEYYVRLVDNDILRICGQWLTGDFTAFAQIPISLTIDKYEYGEPFKIRTGESESIGLTSWANGKALTIRNGIFNGFDIDSNSGSGYPGTSRITVQNCLIYQDVMISYMREILVQFNGCTFSDSEIFIGGTYEGVGSKYDSELYFSDCVFINSYIQDDDEDTYTDSDGTKKILRVYGDIYARHCIFTMSKSSIEHYLQETTAIQKSPEKDGTYRQDYKFENSTCIFNVNLPVKFTAFEQTSKWDLNYWIYGLPDTSEKRSFYWKKEYLNIDRGLWDRERKGPGAFFFAHQYEKYGLTFTYFRLNVGEITYKGIPFIFPGGRYLIEGGSYKPEVEPGEVFCINDFLIKEIPAAPYSEDGNPQPYQVHNPLQDNTNNKPALYFGFGSENLNGTDQLLFFSLENLPIYNRRNDDNVFEVLPELKWQYFGKNGWNDILISDKTKGFSRSHIIEFTFPDNALKSVHFGSEQYWIRAVVKNADITSIIPAKIKGIYHNAIYAENLITVKNEVLGTSIGLSGQSFKMQHTPVSIGQQIWVRELDIPTNDEYTLLIAESLGIKISDVNETIRELFDGVRITNTIEGTVQDVYVRWVEVPDFINSTPLSRHYTLNRFSGEVIFGDGDKGKIPDSGRDNIIAGLYRYGGGTYGNISIGAIKEVRNTIPLIKGVTNFENGMGGGDAETIEQVTTRGPLEVSAGGRSVGETDIESIVQSVSTNVVQVKCFDTEAADLLSKYGSITIAILTSENSSRPMPSQHVIADIYQKLQNAISIILKPQMKTFEKTVSTGDKRNIPELIETVKIIAPNYVTVSIETEVFFGNISTAKEQASEIEKSLYEFMHPVTGGIDGKGWSFGNPIGKSVIQQFICSKPGVASVSSIKLKANQIRLITDLIPDDIIPREIALQPSAGMQVKLFDEQKSMINNYYLLGENAFSGDESIVLEGFKEGDIAEVVLKKVTGEELIIGKTRLTSFTIMLLSEDQARIEGYDYYYYYYYYAGDQRRRSLIRVNFERLIIDSINVKEDGTKQYIEINDDDILFLRTVRNRMQTNGYKNDVYENIIQSRIVQLTQRNGVRYGDIINENETGVKKLSEMKVVDLVSLVIDVCPFIDTGDIPAEIVLSIEDPSVNIRLLPDGFIREYTERVFLSKNDLPCSGMHSVIVRENEDEQTEKDELVFG